MNGALFYILLAACPHEGNQCSDVKMSVVRAGTRAECLIALEREMVNWRIEAPVIRGDCVITLAATPLWWRAAQVASN